MPNINIEVSDSILTAVRTVCAKSGKRQKEWVLDAIKAALWASPMPGHVDISAAIGEVIASSSPPPAFKSVQEQVRAHDPKKCSVYRCGKCAVSGVKDSQRGLK